MWRLESYRWGQRVERRGWIVKSEWMTWIREGMQDEPKVVNKLRQGKQKVAEKNETADWNDLN